MADRQPGTRVLIDSDGKLKPQGCTLGDARILLDPDGKVTLTGLHPRTVYLLIGDGGVGKSTLLRHIAMNPPPSYSAFHLDVIPPEARELDLEQTSEQLMRLFLVDHFDHILLAQPQAEYWKEEVAQLRVPLRVQLKGQRPESRLLLEFDSNRELIETIHEARKRNGTVWVRFRLDYKVKANVDGQDREYVGLIGPKLVVRDILEE